MNSFQKISQEVKRIENKVVIHLSGFKCLLKAMLASLASGLLIGIVKFLVIVYSFSKMRTIATAQFFQISFCYFFQAGSTVISRLLRATISPSVVSREWSVVGAAATSNSGSVCSSEPRRRSSVRRLMRGLTSWDFLR